MAIDAINATQQPPQGPKKKGPADLAKALGITEDQLKKMKPEDVQKLAKQKGVNLDEYAKPGENPPRPPQNGNRPNSVFKH